MRIGLTGTSGTGKTTLAEKIAKQYEMRLVTNVVRNSPGGQFMKVNYSATALNQLSILTTLAAWSEIHDTVSERTPLDALAHSPDVLNAQEWNFALRVTNTAMENYDLIIYCPYYGWELQDDPYRLSNEKYLMGLDSFIAQYLVEKVPGRRVVTMGDIPVEERMSILEEFIN